MKKLLYGSTALAAAALLAGTANAAERIKLGLGGYFNSAIAFGDADEPVGTSLREHGTSQESEIYFFGKTTLDNGIEFGVMVQLEGETSADQMDNAYIWMESGFGRIEAGEEWSPSLKMSYGTVGDPLSGAGGFGDFGSQNPGVNYNGLGGINTYGGNAGVHARPVHGVTYYTPRIAGFQLGVSYMPEGNYAPGAFNGFDNNTASNPLQGDANGPVASELFDVGVNFVQKFGDFNVALFGSWFDSGDTEPAVVGGPSAGEIDGWSIGGEVGWMGFRVGGRYTEKDDQLVAGGAPTPGAENTGWRLGIDYTTGPWMVGIAYHEQEGEPAAGADLKTELISTGARYTLGPGVTLYGGVQIYDVDGGVPAASGEPVVAIFGTVLQF